MDYNETRGGGGFLTQSAEDLLRKGSLIKPTPSFSYLHIPLILVSYHFEGILRVLDLGFRFSFTLEELWKEHLTHLAIASPYPLRARAICV